MNIYTHHLLAAHNLWIVFGFFAQFVFFMRFVVQWYVSERRGESIVPMSFWYISIAGTLLIIVYSYHVNDIVFFVANLLSLVIYFRNIALAKRTTPARHTASPEDPS